MTITLRSEKGSELTFTEMDDNFLAIRERELAFFVSGGSADDEVIWSFVTMRTLLLPTGLTGSQVIAHATPPLTGSFLIKVDTLAAGTINFASGVGSFVFGGFQELPPGTELSVVSNGDYTFDTLAVTFRALLT